MIVVENVSIVKLNSNDKTKFSHEIKENLFELKQDYGKVKNLHLPFRLLFNGIISCLIPKEDIYDQISWDHKYFVWFLINDQPLNLSTYIFHHLCKSVKDSQKRNKKSFPYVRFLSELFYQCRLIDVLKYFNATGALEDCLGSVLSTIILANMHVIKKKDLVMILDPIRIRKDEIRMFIENMSCSLKQIIHKLSQNTF